MRNSELGHFIEDLVYGTIDGRTFTQRSPIMPDVWIRYGMEGPGPKDLLLVAHWDDSGPELAAALGARFAMGRPAHEIEPARANARIATTQSVVAAELSFRDLMRLALPMSPWWHRYLVQGGEPSAQLSNARAFAELRRALHSLLQKGHVLPSKPRVFPDLGWLTRVSGGLVLLHERSPLGLRGADEARVAAWQDALRDPDAVLDAFFSLFEGVATPPSAEHLWAVHRNRRIELAIRDSTSTVKADAARHVFDVTGRGVAWGVLDTGIDLRHVAFRRRRSDGKLWSDSPFRYLPPAPDPALEKAKKGRATPPGPQPPKHWTRIVATYDFTVLRDLMSAPSGAGQAAYIRGLPASLRQRLATKTARQQLTQALRQTRGQLTRLDNGKVKVDPAGRALDWLLWEPLLAVPHTSEVNYEPPIHTHGTHVAGILGADWRPNDLPEDVVKEEIGAPRRQSERSGMCPEIELYDLRVLNRDGSANEFALLAALQFVRALNARHAHLVIHGVNLSLSLPHEVSNYACGRTPVCEECDRLVASGVIVVAAAGNQGMARYVSASGETEDGYRTVSISDPGNADSVITVGATHRAEPHAFGVSYFSSRGPTGDGRPKPDLVAPGEKVTSTVYVDGADSEESMDGTSMAAPHVSGAAALLLCRHRELIGRPAEVKRVLCATATDLHRDRYFQGAGLLDTLRALESF